ncbi:hypothetical protein EYF80_056361 [Liparis tanakae]|uniref:Uncharacterized protein n=1 Tax=Liparis tanakae TaxID=230148 RepID=A0A4Z2EYN5_9TELE|nr:hypothetical protein EYF80_056361 [Liparis tanakae]
MEAGGTSPRWADGVVGKCRQTEGAETKEETREAAAEAERGRRAKRGKGLEERWSGLQREKEKEKEKHRRTQGVIK